MTTLWNIWQLQIRDVKAGIVEKFLEIEVLKCTNEGLTLFKLFENKVCRSVYSSLCMKAPSSPPTCKCVPHWHIVPAPIFVKDIKRKKRWRKLLTKPLRMKVSPGPPLPHPVNVFHCVLVQRRPPWWHSAFGIDLTRANTFYLHTFLNGQCNYVKIIMFSKSPRNKIDLLIVLLRSNIRGEAQCVHVHET